MDGYISGQNKTGPSSEPCHTQSPLLKCKYFDVGIAVYLMYNAVFDVKTATL